MDNAEEIRKKYYGKVLQYNSRMKGDELKKFYASLPQRRDLIDKELNRTIESRIAKTEDLYFMPTNAFETHLREGGRNRSGLVYRLVLTGCLQDGSGAAVIIEDIDVYFDARVPDSVTDLDRFKESLERQLRDAGSYPTGVVHRRMKPFKYYQAEESNYFRLYFSTLFQRKKAISFLTSGSFEFISGDGGLVSEVLETASNDNPFTSRATKQGTVYYRKAAREYKFTLGDWNVLRDYIRDDSGTLIRKQSRAYTFRVSVGGFVPLAGIIDKQSVDSLKRDKTLVCARDYETYDNKPTGNAPLPEHVFDEDGNERAIIFMGAMTYHWHWSAKPLLVVNITEMPTPPRDDCLIIQVDSQLDIIRVEALLVSRMAPDIICGFNDGSYDNPFMFRRAEEFDARHGTGLVQWIRKYTSCVVFNEETDQWLIGGPALEDKIKMEAGETIRNEFINNQGVMGIDVRTIFRQINPTAEESSLNFFLTKYKLELKEDMEYTTMFRIYNLTHKLLELFYTRSYSEIMERMTEIERVYGPDFKPLEPAGLQKLGLAFKPSGTVQANGRPWPSHIDHGIYHANSWTVAEQIKLLELSTKVVSYCNVDSTRCLDLLIAGNVIPDRREVAILSYTSLYDCFYRAGGMKVRNLVISEGVKPEWNYAFDNLARGEKTDKKYPGAYVVPPKKGLYRDHVIFKRKRRHANFAVGEEGAADPAKEKFTLGEVSPDNPLFDKRLLDAGNSLWKVGDNRMSTDENEEIDRPCTGLDFSSLYPSLMMAYNLSPEKTLRPGVDPDVVYQELSKKYPGKPMRDLIHQVEFRYGFDDQPEEDKQLIHGKFVRHVPMPFSPENGNGKVVKYEGMGLYPFILLNLFNQRADVKKKMEYYGCPKEFMESIMGAKVALSSELDGCKREVHDFLSTEADKRLSVVKQHAGTQKENYYKWQHAQVVEALEFFEHEWFGTGQYSQLSFDELYKTICFYHSYYNTKQLALKVFMNTFYGETGNALSPFFIVQVAGAITTSGKNNIHMVKNFVESQGYSVKYGDTDSLYICCPEACFAAADAEYLAGRISRLDYWSRMIEITMETIDKFKNEVNGLLARDNGTRFLKMAYEEVLFPFAMVGKKKYIGIKHEGIVNLSACMPDITPENFMKSRSLFIRGLEIKKRGASQFLKINVFAALRDMFNVSTTRAMIDIFESKLVEVAQSAFDPKVFVRTAKYKLPGKNEFGQLKQGNVTVLEFARRMARLEREHPELGIKCPEIGERFQYVVTRKMPYRYDIRGRKVAIKIGEKYEDFKHFENVRYHALLGGPLEVDRDYYMENEISGQFARFIVYHPKYDKYCKDGMDPSQLSDEEYKVADKKAIDFAKKELQKFYRLRFAYKYEERGVYYKELFKDASEALNRGMERQYGSKAVLLKHTQNITTDTDDMGDYTYNPNTVMKSIITQKLCAQAQKAAKTGASAKVKKYITKCGGRKCVHFMYDMFVSGKKAMHKERRKLISKKISDTQKLIEFLVPEYQKICLHNTAIMSKIIDEKDTIRSSVLPEVALGEVDDTELSYFRQFMDSKTPEPTKVTEVEEKLELPEIQDPEVDRILGEMYLHYLTLVGAYRSEIEMNELESQLVVIKDEVAGNPNIKPKDIKPREQIEDLMSWLNTKSTTNIEATPSKPLIVKTAIGEIDLF